MWEVRASRSAERCGVSVSRGERRRRRDVFARKRRRREEGAVDPEKKKPNDRDARVSGGRRAFAIPGRRRDARVRRAV